MFTCMWSTKGTDAIVYLLIFQFYGTAAWREENICKGLLVGRLTSHSLAFIVLWWLCAVHRMFKSNY